MLFLIKLSLIWGGFVLFYTLVLRKETFFRANRIFLLAAFLFGPLLAFWGPGRSGALTDAMVDGGFGPVFSISAGQAGAIFRWSDGLLLYGWWGLWALGALGVAARLFAGLSGLKRLAAEGIKTPLENGLLLVQHIEIEAPCSFGRWIFWPDEQGTDDAVLAHECAHARAQHTIDILLVEFITIILWFHPMVYWFRRALRTVHEYEADAAAAQRTSKKQYGLLLIGRAQSGMPLAFANHFFQSPLKQRLFMLTKTTSPAKHSWKYALSVPVFVWAFFLSQTTLLIAQTDSPDAKPEKLAEFPGGQQALFNYLVNEVKYPASARQNKKEGKVYVAFLIEKDGSISQVKQADKQSHIDESLVAEAIRVVKSMPKWNPAVLDGMPVRCTYTLPIKFALE